jgi:hypothetical protein
MYFPERSAQFSGSDIAAMMEVLEGDHREDFILEQVRNGCVPDFMRVASQIILTGAGGMVGNLEVCPDYLCLGTDDDYIYAQCSIVTAQKIADEIGAMLPTKKIVDEVWKQAAGKIDIVTQTPDKKMVTSPVFLKQSRDVIAKRLELGLPLGSLQDGGFKNYILVPGLQARPGQTCIYGFHRKATNRPVQDPNLSAHDKNYVDYSQCPRFMALEMFVGDDLLNVADVLAHVLLHVLVTSDGASKVHRFPGV